MPCRSGSPHEVLSAGAVSAPVVRPWHATHTSATSVVKAATPINSRIRCLISHLRHPLDATNVPQATRHYSMTLWGSKHGPRPLPSRRRHIVSLVEHVLILRNLPRDVDVQREPFPVLDQLLPAQMAERQLLDELDAPEFEQLRMRLHPPIERHADLEGPRQDFRVLDHRLVL